MRQIKKSLILFGEGKTEATLQRKLDKHSVHLVLSEPSCLEGLFLQLLDDAGPKTGKNDSQKLKQYFQTKYLGTDRKTEYVAKLKQACPKLFSKECIEEKRIRNPCIRQILEFLEV